MQRGSLIFIALALAAIGLLIARHPHSPARPSPPPSVSQSPAPQSPPVTITATVAPVPVPTTAIRTPSPVVDDLNHQTAAALTLLRAWDDDDDPATRPDRLQALDHLLAGTNAFAIVAALPAELLGYAFAAPSFRQQLLAHPSATLDWLASHTNILASQGTTFLQLWRTDDAGGLAQAIDRLPDGDSKQTLLALAANGLLTSNPAESIDWADRLPAGPSRDNLLRLAVSEWASRDPLAAAGWLGSLADSSQRRQLTGTFAASFAQIDPARAADWLVQCDPTLPVLNQSLGDIAWTWAQNDPAAAADWIETFPAGPTRAGSLASLVNVWGNHDPASLAVWIASLPDDTLRADASRLFSNLSPAAP